MFREIERKLQKFYSSHPQKAIMLLGPRQVGKTYSILKFAKNNYTNIIKLDFVEDISNINLIKGSFSANETMLRISAKYGKSLKHDNTLIFFDEVQVVPELIGQIKYLVQNYSYDFILSGSLLGAILKDVDSIPVGYIDIYRMGPMTFKEFLTANNTDIELIKNIYSKINTRKRFDEYIHSYLLEMFQKYLIVGGMPEVVQTYITEHNLASVRAKQGSLIKAYKYDISKYNSANKLYLNEIYEMVPSQLNKQNKRFFLNKLGNSARFSKYENAFFWLKNAGIVLPTYRCSEAKTPLKLTKDSSKFKLYMSDVGLLTYCYGQNAQIQLLQNNDKINCGAIYENAMAQMLLSNNDELYYYQNKQKGEVDFLQESPEGITAIEVKSGKDYKRHVALTNLIKSKNCNKAIVACNSNIQVNDKVIYMPIYAFGLLSESPQRNIKF